MTKTTRRQAEREERGYAEGVVDRRADVAVRGGEEGVRPEDALELVRLATPSCHGGTVVPAAVAPAPATGPVAIITRHGASRSSRRTSRGKARWKPRRDSTGAPTTTSSARRSAATRATSSPKLPGRVRTISRRTRDTVRARDRGRRLEPLLQAHELPVEVRVERQLALEDEPARRARFGRRGRRRAGRRGRARAPSPPGRAAARRCCGRRPSPSSARGAARAGGAL